MLPMETRVWGAVRVAAEATNLMRLCRVACVHRHVIKAAARRAYRWGSIHYLVICERVGKRASYMHKVYFGHFRIYCLGMKMCMLYLYYN